MDEIAFADARTLVKQIQDKEISSRELLDLFLSRIEKFDGDLNAVVCKRVEYARDLEEAQEAEAAKRVAIFINEHPSGNKVGFEKLRKGSPFSKACATIRPPEVVRPLVTEQRNSTRATPNESQNSDHPPLAPDLAPRRR